MKTISFAHYTLGVCAAAILLVLTGCSSSGSSGTITPSGASPGSQMRLAQSIEFLYVTNEGSNNVSAYTIDATSGALTPVAGAPFSAGLQPVDAAVDPKGKFAYVVDVDCILPPSCGQGPDSDVSAYKIDATSGRLNKVKGSPFPVGSDVRSVAVDPMGKFAYLAGGFQPEGFVSAYHIDARGRLKNVKGSPFRAGDDSGGVTVDPAGPFVYAINHVSNNVSAYTIDAISGKLKKVKGSPFAAGTDPYGHVAVDPEGKFAYAANNGSNNVSAYTIDATSGALTPVAGSPFAAGSDPSSVAIDPMRKFAYVTNNGSNNVSAYTIDATSGTLNPMTGSPFGTGAGPMSVTIDPAGKFAYVTDNGSNNVSAYTIDAFSGKLKKVKGSPFGAGTGPWGISVCRVTASKCIPPPL